MTTTTRRAHPAATMTDDERADAIRRLDERADIAEAQNDHRLALLLRQEAFYIREESRRAQGL